MAGRNVARNKRRWPVALLSVAAAAFTALGASFAQSSSVPQAEIESGPNGTARSSEATFAFSSDDPEAEFLCSLDSGGYQACQSPKTYTGLADGSHSFSVELSSDSGDGSSSAGRSWIVRNLLHCTDANELTNFPVYSLGSGVDGLQFSSVTRLCGSPTAEQPIRPNYVSYLYGYGDCDSAAGDSPDCSGPLEIQTWPACERSLADYEISPGVPYPHERLGDVRGVPAFSFDGGTRIELYAGDATIVLFAPDPTIIDDALASITLEPSDRAPSSPSPSEGGGQLPAPVDGAMEGSLSCS